jgi:hypothetical protein
MNVTELQRLMAALPPVDGPTPLHTWPRHQLSLRRHTAGDNPYEMLRWSTVVATFFVGSGADFTDAEVDELPGRYIDILQEPLFGKPDTLQVNGMITSGNLIHQAYHLYQFEQHAGIKVEGMESIVEFGGGYGALALLCRRLGFTGKYTIIDLPELSLLQRFYLSNTIGTWGMEFVSDYNFDLIIPELLFAIYSLSEIPVKMRYDILQAIPATYVFMAHQDFHTMPDGDKVDNIASFSQIAKDFDLDHWENRLMPSHYYLCTKGE